jgi:hypothetical protein
MPMFYYICETCGPVRRIFDVEPKDPVCKNCGKLIQRRRQGAHAQVMEVLDNGIQARATVRPADAQRIFKEREIAHDAEYGEPRPDEADMEPIDDSGDLV